MYLPYVHVLETNIIILDAFPVGRLSFEFPSMLTYADKFNKCITNCTPNILVHRFTPFVGIRIMNFVLTHIPSEI